MTIIILFYYSYDELRRVKKKKTDGLKKVKFQNAFYTFEIFTFLFIHQVILLVVYHLVLLVHAYLFCEFLLVRYNLSIFWSRLNVDSHLAGRQKIQTRCTTKMKLTLAQWPLLEGFLSIFLPVFKKDGLQFLMTRLKDGVCIWIE